MDVGVTVSFCWLDALISSGVCGSIRISVHSIEDEIEITSGGSYCDVVPGVSECSGVGIICTWHTIFLLPLGLLCC